jgi:hypothetical protein
MTTGWDSIRSVDGASMNVARVAIHAFGFSAGKAIVPVHVTRLSTFFRRYHPDTSVTGPLQLLQLLKEAIGLPNGFWIPAPFRSISITGQESLLIAPHPTKELERALGKKIERLEFGRMCADELPSAVANESIDVWSEAIPSLSGWMRQFSAASIKRLQDTVTTGRNIRIYNTWNDTASRSGSGPSWYPYPCPTIVPDGLNLCSETAQGVPIRKFVGSFAAGLLRKECDINDSDAILFRFGLELQRNRHLTLRPSMVADGYTMHISRTLPRSQMMILTVLASEIRETDYGVGVALTFKKSVYPIIRSSLESVGITLQGNQ